MFFVFEDEVEVVGGDEGGEGVGEEADGIGFAEGEVEEQEGGAGEGEVPEGVGDDGAAGFSGGVELEEPAAGEEEGAEVADEFPGGDGEGEEGKEMCMHGYLVKSLEVAG